MKYWYKIKKLRRKSCRKIEKLINDNTYEKELGDKVLKPPSWHVGIQQLGTDSDLYYRKLSGFYFLKMFKNKSLGSSGVGLRNEDFISWMRTPAYVTIKDLHDCSGLPRLRSHLIDFAKKRLHAIKSVSPLINSIVEEYKTVQHITENESLFDIIGT